MNIISKKKLWGGFCLLVEGVYMAITMKVHEKQLLLVISSFLAGCVFYYALLLLWENDE